MIMNDIGMTTAMITSLIMYLEGFFILLFLKADFGKTVKSIDYYLLFYFCMSFSFGLIIGRGYLPQFISVNVANATIILGAFLLMKGVFLHYNYKQPFSMFFIIFGAIHVVLFMYFTYVRASVTARLFLSYLSVGILFSITAVIVHRCLKNNGRKTDFMYIILIYHSLLYLFGATMMLVTRESHESLFHFQASSLILYIQGISGLVIVVGLISLLAKEFRQSLRESEEKYKLLFSSIGDPLFLVDLTTKKLLDVNEAACRLYGYERDEFLTLTADSLSAEPEKTAQTFRHLPDKIDLRYYRKKDGTVFPIEITISPITLDGQKMAVVSVRDITEREKAQQKLEYLNHHDYLTGLYNRKYFEEMLKELDREENLPISCIMIDLNGLKMINDSFGHSLGDQLLISVSETLRWCCPAGTLMARLGGDEFVVMLPKTNRETAGRMAFRINGAASQKSFQNISVSIAYGFETKHTMDEDIATVLANAENYMYRRKLYLQSSSKSKIIDVIISTLFEKSPRESLHSKRVSQFCKVIAEAMNFHKDRVNKISIAGLVHDIGKISINLSILDKPGSLSDAERQEMESHTESGWRILSSCDEFVDLANYVLSHHERWDGAGYPKQLKGEEIPVEARIISVADSYDAMTSERTYKKAMTREEAMEELQRCSGTQFDPAIVDIFIHSVLSENPD